MGNYNNKAERACLLGHKLLPSVKLQEFSFLQGDSEDPLLHFSERSVFLVAKQVAAGLVSNRSRRFTFQRVRRFLTAAVLALSGLHDVRPQAGSR